MKWLSLGIVFWSNIVFAGSFGGQTNFTTRPVEGELHIYCREGFQSESRFVYCEDTRLDPFEYAYFEGENDVGADELRITSQRADGKQVEKKVEYNSSTGRSKKRVNLWIWTLLQKPLLDTGDNKITYELLQNSDVKKTGEFTATVTPGERRICPSDTEWSNSMNDCRFPEIVCDRYFMRHNWCESRSAK